MAAALPSDNRLREPLAAAFDRVPASWRPVTEAFRASAEGRDLIDFVDGGVAGGAADDRADPLRALHLTPLDQVRVLVLGQDPYHGPGQAHGLAFSVPEGLRTPPSLRNICSEVVADIGAALVGGNDLTPWARQGVLLLNTALTVEDGQPQSHAKRGWERLTDALVAAVSARAAPSVFLLWGAPAQKKRALVDESRHAVLAANHPSPLSARRGPVPFLGCRHFSRTNELLARLRPGEPPVRW